MAPKGSTGSSGNKRAAADPAPGVSPASKRTRTDTKTQKKDPKASHLYTDDNPETTLHGTGFKDAATAKHTIELVSERSLTYQFQTINTMLYRAKGHKHKTVGIEAAIDIFQPWVDEYKQRKSELRSFPLLPKPKVKDYLHNYDRGKYDDIPTDEEFRDAETFAMIYVELGARKRLANTLVDQQHPEREDWEIRRYKHLCDLLPEHEELGADELWQGPERDQKPTAKHLTMIFWGYSPSRKV